MILNSDTSATLGFHGSAGCNGMASMVDLNTSEVHSRTITAFFETREAAEKAQHDLERTGIPSQHIRLVAGGDHGTTSTADDGGFWASLKDLFLPDEDRYAYAEGLRRGGYVLSVNTDEANYDRVLDIVDVDGSVDMNQREANWKTEGWKGYEGTRVPDAGAAALPLATGVGGAAAAPTATATPSTATNQDDVIPVYEEKLQVGKRDVNHGRVRVRSYVVETPVNAQVDLHSETVQIDRRPVDRVVGGADAAFKDRVIEVEEHAEEAVIAKEVRVKEEIGLRKTAEDRVQTVSDSVRHTEVDIEDARSGAATGTARFSPGKDSSRIVEHMDVIASDGKKIGTVDHLDGPERIKLAKTTSPDGEHHYIPLAWVDHVDTHVHLTKPTAEVQAAW